MNSKTWFVESLTIKNFRQYDNFTIDFNQDVTLLIGENGSGKTTILDALAVMLSVILKQLNDEGKNLTSEDARRIPSNLDSVEAVASTDICFPIELSVTAIVDGENWTWSRSKPTAKSRTTMGEKEFRDFVSNIRENAQKDATPNTVLPIIAYYGVERLLREIRNQGSVPSSRFSAYDHALDPRSDINRFSRYFRMLFIESLKKRNAAIQHLNAIVHACNRVLEPTGWKDPEWNETVGSIVLRHDDYGYMPLDMLATGTKIAAGLTIDIASRLARANPAITKPETLLSCPGIVLIDEVDLHLHPIWQKEIAIVLRETFPGVQFVLTTHSPHVISSVPNSSVRNLVSLSVETPEFHEGLRPEVILETIQRTNTQPITENRKKLDEYLALVYKGEGTSIKALELRKYLDEKMGGKEFNEELIDADSVLEIESWDL